MSLLAIADEKLKISLQESGTDKLRLVIVYPREPVYCRRVRNALSDLLRSDPTPDALEDADETAA